MQLGEKYKVITESSLCDAKNVRRPVCGRVVYITPVYSGVADADIALREACAAVSYAKPGSGTITFVCLEDKPQTNIPVQVEVKR